MAVKSKLCAGGCKSKPCAEGCAGKTCGTRHMWCMYRFRYMPYMSYRFRYVPLAEAPAQARMVARSPYL